MQHLFVQLDFVPQGCLTKEIVCKICQNGTNALFNGLCLFEFLATLYTSSWKLFLKLVVDQQVLIFSLQKIAFHEMHHFDISVLTGVGFEPIHTLVKKNS